MKSILCSTQPRHVVSKINGLKTIEIRKTKPKELPFKVYEYCTHKEPLYISPDGGFTSQSIQYQNPYNHADFGFSTQLNGKVVLEYVVNEVEQFNLRLNRVTPQIHRIGINACLSYDELNAYLNGKNGFALHITDLKVYDEPLELGEFGTFCKDFLKCENIACYKDACEQGFIPLSRPPQSWQYVRRR